MSRARKDNLISDNLISSPEEAEKKLAKFVEDYYKKHHGGVVVVLRKSRAPGKYKIEIKIAVDAEESLIENLLKKEDHETKAYKLLVFSPEDILVLHKGVARRNLVDETDPAIIFGTIDKTISQHLQLEIACGRNILGRDIIFISQNGKVYSYEKLRSLQVPLERLETLEEFIAENKEENKQEQPIKRKGFVRLTGAEKIKFQKQVLEKSLEGLKEEKKKLDEQNKDIKSFGSSLDNRRMEIHQKIEDIQEQLSLLTPKGKPSQGR